MRNHIIVDSCCDMPDSMKAAMNVTTVPLTMMLGHREFVDDETLNLPEFMKAMKTCTEKIGSASPSPYLYQEAVQGTRSDYVITLSSQLSGSYCNAVLGNKQAQEETGHSAYIFNSKSASAGETLIAIKLYELLGEGLPTAQIIQAVHSFIDSMKTYFVLENYDNLQKNGRLGRIAGNLIQILGVKLIMGSDGEGNIALFEKVRGVKRMVGQLLALIEKSGKKTENESLVLAHTNNPELAEHLSSEIKARFTFKNIYIVPTGGLSALYTDDKGIVIAF